MRQFLPTRSDEPMYWLMFGAGGMVAAMVLPAIMVVLIAAGLYGDGITEYLNYTQVTAIFGNWLLSLVVFGVVFLLSFYALHRMHHSSHVQLSHPLTFPSPPAFNLSQHQDLLQ